MRQFEKRVRALELAAGQAEDNSFCAQVLRMLARGESVPNIIVDPRKGETIESVREREGIPDDMPCIVLTLVEPTGWRAETDSRLRALKLEEERDE